MIKAKTYPDFKEFVKGFVANVKAGKRYDFRKYQEAVLPLTYSSPWPESDIPEVTDFNYTPDYTVPFSGELLYAVGSQMRTADFFMDLQYVLINGKDIDTVYCEWLARVKPFSMLNAKLKEIPSNPPVITTQPVGTTITEGDELTLTIVAENATNYKWFHNETQITDSSTPNFTKQNSTLEDAGQYKCVVSGAGGEVTSNVVDVVVNAKPTPPVFTKQPESQSLFELEPLELTVEASGADTYQWKKDGSDLPDATTATYHKDNVALEDAGNYTCVATGAGGSTESDTATVKVSPQPEAS
ncbi:tail protein [Citrobacter phage Michonne]|uniref:Tail protein n=1 Tax=Citrobacter phage Michonne TaxID=1675603 RepID=A0A0K1LNP9_9CAUD|nr:tail protein [Citrobacter phage Michonne]AKU44044.1 tail protein [Citrobacter phage Michonne]AYR00837.1 tail protein [Citrobacter phage Maleficent]